EVGVQPTLAPGILDQGVPGYMPLRQRAQPVQAGRKPLRIRKGNISAFLDIVHGYGRVAGISEKSVLLLSRSFLPAAYARVQETVENPHAAEVASQSLLAPMLLHDLHDHAEHL